jgi:hypothetical protein
VTVKGITGDPNDQQAYAEQRQVLSLTRHANQEATDEKSMPRQDKAMGKWKPSVDIRYLLTMMRAEEMAIQPMQAPAVASCTHSTSTASPRKLERTTFPM